MNIFQMKIYCNDTRTDQIGSSQNVVQIMQKEFVENTKPLGCISSVGS